MSNEPKIQNEDELWDVLNTPVETPEKTAKSTTAAPAENKPEPRENSGKSGRKIDGFFLGSMAGVAAVSVAATILISSMLAGNTNPSAVPGSADKPDSGNVSVSADPSDLEQLRLENAELKAKVELQQKTIVDLQNDLVELMGAEQYLENVATAPSGENEVLDEQTEAYRIYTEIQAAYAEFDREALEELIPEMDARLKYLTPDALNNYYLILEYMEQPSNG